MDYFIEPLKNYALFTGRSSRKQYWMFVLISLLISIAFGIVGGILHLPILSTLYSLVVLVPSIAIGIRRMHDTDHSGWWLLLPIVNLVFACTDSTPGPNRFGENPKGLLADQGFAVVPNEPGI